MKIEHYYKPDSKTLREEPQVFTRWQDTTIEQLQQESKQLKSILTELEEELNIAYKELQPGELVIGQDILKNIQTLIQELKEKYK